MSAPDTNVPEQARRHKFPLTVIAGVLLLVAVLFAGLMVLVVDRGTEDDGVEVEINVPAGEVTVAD